MIPYINTFELLSDYKSFRLTLSNASEWIGYLMHLKNHEIDQHEIIYRKNTGIRQRKNTVYPNRRLRKKFKNTSELLEYLSFKQYDICLLILEFSNGWKIKIESNYIVNIYTNSQEERNTMFTTFLTGYGYDEISLNSKLINITYMLHFNKAPIPLGVEPLPDEFWNEEDVDDWKKKTATCYN